MNGTHRETCEMKGNRGRVKGEGGGGEQGKAVVAER